MEEKYLYILLTHTGSIVSSLIKRFSELEYSHISIGVDPSYQTFYSFGRIKETNPLIAGFVMENVKDGVYRRFYNATYSLYKLEVNEKKYKRFVKELGNFVDNNKAYKYNFLGLMSAKIGYSLDRKNAYFCSQFAAEIFKKAEIYDFKKPHGLISPMDFSLIPNVELISTGELKDFRENLWKLNTPDRTKKVSYYSKKLARKITGIKS